MGTPYIRGTARRALTGLASLSLVTGAMIAAAAPQAKGHAVTNPYSPAYQHTYRHGVVPTAQQNQGIKDKQNSYAWSSPFGSLKHRVIGAMLKSVVGGKSYPLELMRHTWAGRPQRPRTLAAPSRTCQLRP